MRRRDIGHPTDEKSLVDIAPADQKCTITTVPDPGWTFDRTREYSDVYCSSSLKDRDIDGNNVGRCSLFTRFIKPENLDTSVSEAFSDIVRRSYNYTKLDRDSLEGSFAVVLEDKGNDRGVPATIEIGKVSSDPNLPGQFRISNDLVIYMHFGKNFVPKLFGIDRDPDHFSRFFEDAVLLSPTEYKFLIESANSIPSETTVLNPDTKTAVRQNEKFRELIRKYESMGLVEVPGAILKLEHNQQQESTEKKEPEHILGAVHPYFLDYYDQFGKKNAKTPAERSELIAKFDRVFSEHRGPLVIVEEESKMAQTIERVKRVGRQGDTYFVISAEATSRLPYTYFNEFTGLLKSFGLQDIKFVGGFDWRDDPGVDFDIVTELPTKTSGCLGSLMNSLKETEIQDIQIVPGYTYS